MQGNIADDPRGIRVCPHNVFEGIQCVSRGLVAHQYEVTNFKLSTFNDLFMSLLKIRQVFSHPPLPEVINFSLDAGVACNKFSVASQISNEPHS